MDCPCCGKKNAFSEEDSFEMCRVCGWENDRLQIKYPDDNGANYLSLNEARKRWTNGETLFPDFPNKGTKE